jgi:hypothetical protein
VRHKATIGCASVAAVAALSIAYVPFRESDTEHACQGPGGAIVWIVDGSRRQADDAQQDIGYEQHVLDLLAQNPNVADAAHRQEYTEDATDQIRADHDTIAAIGPCDHVADIRLGLGVVAAALAATAVVLLFAAGRRVTRWWRGRRPAPATPKPVIEHCPVCGAVLDDPIGCWSCGAFEDGDEWRAPANAPPPRARRLRTR